MNLTKKVNPKTQRYGSTISIHANNKRFILIIRKKNQFFQCQVQRKYFVDKSKNREGNFSLDNNKLNCKKKLFVYILVGNFYDFQN